MELRLPDNPTEDDLIVIEKYLKAAKKKVITGKKAYQNKKTLIAGKLIIFQPSQRVKGDNYSMRYYVGDRKYKVLSLSTNDETAATEKALEKWRILSNHLEGGGSVFSSFLKENLWDEMLIYYSKIFIGKSGLGLSDTMDELNKIKEKKIDKINKIGNSILVRIS